MRFVAATLLTLVVTTPALAQATNPATNAPQTTSASKDNDNDFDMGWLGLIGLAGLAGLMRGNKRHDTTTTRVH
ncbi:WGxxGxxG family protein [Methylorubrum extorquens]